MTRHLKRYTRRRSETAPTIPFGGQRPPLQLLSAVRDRRYNSFRRSESAPTIPFGGQRPPLQLLSAVRDRLYSLLQIDFAHFLLDANYFDLVPEFVGQADGFWNRFEQNNGGR